MFGASRNNGTGYPLRTSSCYDSSSAGLLETLGAKTVAGVVAGVVAAALEVVRVISSIVAVGALVVEAELQKATIHAIQDCVKFLESV